MKAEERTGLCLVVALAIAVLGGCGENGETTAQFRGRLLDFESGAPVPGGEVWALDNNTGEPLEGKVAFAAGDGEVTFNGLPEGYVGFKAVGISGASVDTYSFNFFSFEQDKKIYLVSNNTVLASMALAQVDWDRSKGVAAGTIEWFDGKIEGEGFEIGCATVKTVPESGETRYFADNDIPTTLENRSSTNPNNGYYLFANIDPGSVRVKAFVDDVEIGEVQFLSIAGAVCISDIQLNPDNSSFTANPMPAGCE